MFLSHIIQPSDLEVGVLLQLTHVKIHCLGQPSHDVCVRRVRLVSYFALCDLAPFHPMEGKFIV